MGNLDASDFEELTEDDFEPQENTRELSVSDFEELSASDFEPMGEQRTPSRSTPMSMAMEDAPNTGSTYEQSLPVGMKYRGNIDLDRRSIFRDRDGIKTEHSIGINVDGKETIIPTIVDGKQLSKEDATAHFYKTGEHLGQYDTVEEANTAAENIHRRQQNKYGNMTRGEANRIEGRNLFEKQEKERAKALFDATNSEDYDKARAELKDIQNRKRWTVDNILKDDGVDRDTKAMDYVSSVMGGFSGLLDTTGHVITSVSADEKNSAAYEFGTEVSRIGKEATDWWQAQKSKDAKLASQEKLMGNSVAETIHNVLSNPQSTMLSVADSTAGTMAGMALGGVLSKTFTLLPSVGTTVANAMGYGLGEGALGAAEAHKKTARRIEDMKESDLVKAPEYKALVNEFGGDTKKARETLSAAMAGDEAALTFATTSILSSPMGVLVGRFMNKGNFGDTFGTSLALGSIGETVQETGQGGFEKLNENFVVRKYENPQLPLTQGVGEASLKSGLSGLVMGTGMAVGGEVYQQTPTGKRAKTEQGYQAIADLMDSYDFIPSNAQADAARAHTRGVNQGQRLFDERADEVKATWETATPEQKQAFKEELIMAVQSDPEEMIKEIADLIPYLSDEQGAEIINAISEVVTEDELKALQELIGNPRLQPPAPQAQQSTLTPEEAKELAILEETTEDEMSNDAVWRMEDLQMKRDGIGQGEQEGWQEQPSAQAENKLPTEPMEEAPKAEPREEPIPAEPMAEAPKTEVPNGNMLYEDDSPDLQAQNIADYETGKKYIYTNTSGVARDVVVVGKGGRGYVTVNDNGKEFGVRPHTLSLIGEAEAAPKAEAEAAPKNKLFTEPTPEAPKATKDGKKQIGKNADGEMIYEDENGARYYFDSGFSIGEPIIASPMGAIIPSNKERFAKGRLRYLTEDEVNELSGAEATPKAEAPKEKIDKKPDTISKKENEDEANTKGNKRPEGNIQQSGTGDQPRPNGKPSQQPSQSSDDGAGNDDRTAETNKHTGNVGVEGNTDIRTNAGSKPRNQFTINQNEAATKGEVARFNDNYKAIKLIKEDKSFYTKEELEALSKYTGWGGITKAFSDTSGKYEDGWKDRGVALEAILTEEEYNNAQASILDAFYTPHEVINTMWGISQKLGFDGGSVLEPSVGTGRFIGMVPQNIKNVGFDGIELDGITSKITSILYPRSNIRNIGFEKTNHIENFEMVIGNPPYGDFTVFDPTSKPLSKLSIHNYFVVKSLQAVKAGGVVNFVVTTSFMENLNKTTATMINEKAKLVGAIRLPNNVFKSAGTAVSTDIVIFQKLQEGEEGNIEEWYGKKTLPNGLTVNKYFANNPTMMLGEWVKAFRGNTLKGDPETYQDDLEAAINALPSNIMESFSGTLKEQTQKTSDKTIPSSVIYEKDGEYYVNIRLNENVEAVKVNSKIAKSYIPLRDALKDVITLQNAQNTNTTTLKAARTKLNKTYDDFVNVNGELNKSVNRNVIVNDNYGYTVLALELDGKKAPIFTVRTAKPEKEVRTTDTKEALTITLNRKGNVDIAYLQEVTGKDEDTIIKELEGAIFYDAMENKYVPREVFLSGDVKSKLEATHDQRSIDELLKVIPQDLEAKDIPVQLGASWISPEYIEKYAKTELGFRTVTVLYDKVTGVWSVGGYAYANPFAVPRQSDATVLEKALNGRKIIIKYKIDGKEYVNEEATAYANQKIEDLKDHFSNWIFADAQRSKTLVPLYNDLFNRNVIPDIDKSAEAYVIPNLQEPEFDSNGVETKEGLTPRKHQKNAVYRAVYGNSPLLLNHPVGSGKTLTAQIIAMEWKRLGIANKPIIATLKSVVPQFVLEFKKAYPNANLLVPTEKDFSKENRRKLLSAIATGNYDAIIITHDNLKELRNPDETVKEVLEERIVELQESLEKIDSRGKANTQKKIKKLKQDYEEIVNSKKNEDVLSFSQLGIDGIIVDESHKFKKIGFSSALDIKGIDTEESQMAVDLLIKTRHILKTSNNVVLMTGTPITNTLPELYAIQKILQPELLKQQKIYAFDSWANQYSKTETDVEVAGTGGFKEVTRIKSYENLDALYASVGQVMDTVTNEEIQESDETFKLPKIKGGEPTMVILPASEEQTQYIEKLKERLESVNSKDNPDNYLVIFGDGQRMSLDIRFVVPDAADSYESKANASTDRAVETYKRFAKDKGTQLIFSDTGVPNANGNFDLYGDIKKKLIAKGIPAKEIALIGEYETSEKKNELSRKVNAGEIRFVIGSTQKLGTGINMQERMVAVHHLDIPYTPAELEQRNGRIIRQGNKLLKKYPNFEVEIFYYATEKTLDGTKWQILKNKLTFIQQFQQGNTEVDLDIDEGTAKEQAERMIALSTGNPLLLNRVKAEKRLKKLRSLKRGFNTARADNKNALKEYEEIVNSADSIIANTTADMEQAGSTIKINGKTFEKTADMGQAILDEIVQYKQNKGMRPKTIGSVGTMDIQISYNYNKDVAQVSLVGKTGNTIDINLISQGDLGMGQKMENMSAKEIFQKRIKYINAKVELAQIKIPTIKKALDERFIKQDELEAVEAELTSINEQMKGGSKKSTTEDESSDAAEVKTPANDPMREAFIDLSAFLSAPSRGLNITKNKLDNLIYDHITGKIEDTAVDNFIRRYLGGSMSGLGMLTRKQEQQFVRLYRRMKANTARGEMSAEAAAKLIEEQFGKIDKTVLETIMGNSMPQYLGATQNQPALAQLNDALYKQMYNTVVIQYLENPSARDEIANALPDLANELDDVRDYIDTISKDAMSRGVLLPSQYNKWKGKYLSRLYLIQNNKLDQAVAQAQAGIKMGKIHSGRKIESIVDFVAEFPEKAQALGVVLDPEMMVKMTIAKTQSIVGVEEFFRSIAHATEVINARQTISLDEPIANLPTTFSPYYATNRIIPYINDIITNLEKEMEEGGYDEQEIEDFQTHIENLRDEQQRIREEAEVIDTSLTKDEKKKFAKIPEDIRYGAIAGLPVSKDLASLVMAHFHIAYEPEMFSSKLDEAGSKYLTFFKWAKVPANIYSYPRNLMSNQFQWAMSGADPVTFIPEWLRALKSYALKDEWYDKARAEGLIDDNQMTFEVNQELKRMLQDLQVQGKGHSTLAKINKAMQWIGDKYGAIDDIAKIARMRYAVETDHKTLFDAAMIAQDTHYDYGLTYEIVRAIRDPNISRAVMGKLLFTLFPTYLQKTVAFLYESTIRRPFTMGSIYVAIFLLLNYDTGEDKARASMTEKEWEAFQKSIPAWIKWTPFIRTSYVQDENGEWLVTFSDLGNIIPFGAIAASANAIAHGNITEGLGKLGAGGSPFLLIGDLVNNKDSFTGKQIYYPHDGMKKAEGIAKHIASTIVPNTITRTISLVESQHPKLPRVLGINTYVYSMKDLKEMKQLDANQVKIDASRQAGKYRGNLRRAEAKFHNGEMSADKYLEIKKDMKEKINDWKEQGIEDYREKSPVPSAEIDFKNEIKYAQEKAKELRDLMSKAGKSEQDKELFIKTKKGTDMAALKQLEDARNLVEKEVRAQKKNLKILSTKKMDSASRTKWNKKINGTIEKAYEVGLKKTLAIKTKYGVKE